jgi:peptidoglycan/xylan/chitin deacetylase (PgdA/CDA1 family)
MKYLLLLIAALALAGAGCTSRQAPAPATSRLSAPPAAGGVPERSEGGVGPQAAAPVTSAPVAAPLHLDPASLPLKIIHGNPAVKAVALTIDDGPHPAYTPKILALLAQYHVHATFFVVGKMVAQDKKLVLAEHAAGDLVENHTYNHLDLKQLSKTSPDTVRKEIARDQELLTPLLGAAPQFLRPPAGHTNDQVDQIARSLGLTTVMWNTQSDFGQKDPQVIYDHVVNHVKNGTIILMHDGVPATLIALPRVLATLQKRGYTFETIDELARDLGGKPAA